MTPQMARVKRLLAILPYLTREQGAFLEDLTEKFGISTKTLIEDLQQVDLCGTPPYTPGDYVSIQIDGDFVSIQRSGHFRAPLRLTVPEAMALRIALEQLKPATHGIFRSAIAMLDKKLQRLVGELAEDEEPDDAGKPIRRWAPRRLSERVAALEEARRERRRVEIEYYTSYRDVMSTRVVHPYGFVEDEGNWYLIAFCETRKSQLSFRVDRVKTLRVLDDRFEPPAKLDLRAFKRPSKRGMSDGIPVTVRFAPYMSDWVRERFPAKNLRPLKDGWTEFRFKTPATEWVVRWVLELGGAMEVISPLSAREQAVRSFG